MQSGLIGAGTASHYGGKTAGSEDDDRDDGGPAFKAESDSTGVVTNPDVNIAAPATNVISANASEYLFGISISVSANLSPPSRNYCNPA
jgi:hypothetical protein